MAKKRDTVVKTRNREIRKVKVSDLVDAPFNFRRHSERQSDALNGAIDEIGVFGYPDVFETADGKLMLCDGHLRKELYTKKYGKDAIIEVNVTDFDEAEAKKATLTKDPIAAMADTDAAALAALVAQVEIGSESVLDMLRDLAIDSTDLVEETIEFEEDEVPEPPTDPITKTGDLWILGDHRVLCGDSTKPEDVARLMGGEKADLWITDPPYNVDYTGGTGLKIANDNMGDAQFLQFLVDAFRPAFDAMKPGAAFYIWHADSEGLNFRKAVYECGQDIRQCLIWVKNSLVMGRQDYQWQHEPCQPPGTMVRTPSGEVPIETLSDGDRVVSYNSYSGQITGMRDGRSIKVASRPYDGNLYGVKVGDKRTWTTDTHKFSVRFAPAAASAFCTYLMRRGDWWRVGVTSTYNARGFGLKHRMRQECADEAWIMSIHDTKLDAVVAEQILSAKYGVPQTHWETERGFKVKAYESRTTEMIAMIYAGLDLSELDDRANQMLVDFGRRRDLPFASKKSRRQKCSRRVTVQVAACNMIPGLMEVPVPYVQWDGMKTFDWMPVEAVDRKAYSGPVFSLDVEIDQHYVADGIVTHNCLYSWKKGGAHRWHYGRTETTVIDDAKPAEINKMKREELVQYALDLRERLQNQATTVLREHKPTRSLEHPTMKPIKLIARLMRNSSEKGNLVIDSFLGSGTTLITAEQMGRVCRGVEMSPSYVDVVVHRWENLTSKKAVLAER